MAEECRYYYYDCGYCCAVKREKEGNSSIDSDTVHRYCWGYHYEECPRYKSASSSGGCFLTSACVEAKGLSDDCYELTVLRSFRDEWLRNTEEGKVAVAEYYCVAPIIVEQIQRREDSVTIFHKIYDELVVPCVSLIEAGKNQETYELYRGYTLRLKRLYVPVF